MTTLKQFADNKIVAEMKLWLSEKGYVLETEFLNHSMAKFNFSKMTTLCAMGRARETLSLYRRFLNNDLKRFYNITARGCPAVYLPKE